MPASVAVVVLADRTSGIRASVADVEKELLLAVVLVVLVIFAFLGSLRATVIASIAVPISLIGTFGLMYLLGYSLNNLSLMALTIATGFVVDDAIVMIENISRYIEAGEPPMRAALTGATQIGFTIISLTISLVAVLIPLLFMSDVVGRLFREFAVTLAITILISAVVSLTLVPMMSGRWLKSREEADDAAGREYAYAKTLRPRDARLRPLTGLGLRPSRAHSAGRARHFRGDGAALHRDPQGLVPDAGHRPAAGARRRGTGRLVRAHGAAAERGRACDPRRPGGRESELHRRRRRGQQHHAADRQHADQSARLARQSAARHGPLTRPRERSARREAVPAAHAGSHDRRRDRPDRVSRIARRRQRRTDHGMDGQADRPIARRAASAQRQQRRRRSGPGEQRRRQPRHRFASGHYRERGRRRAVQRVRPAHRLDHLHRDQSVPRDPRRTTRTRDRCRRRRQAEPDIEQRPADAAVGFRDDHRAAHAAADHARRPVSGEHAELRHRARRGARPGGRCDPQGSARHRDCRARSR